MTVPLHGTHLRSALEEHIPALAWCASCPPPSLAPCSMLPATVAFFGYLLNVVTTVLSASGSAAKRSQAVRQKLQASARPAQPAGQAVEGPAVCR